MAIATTSEYRPNRDRVIKGGLQLAGLIHAGHEPTTAQLAMGAEFLLDGMLALQAEGVFLRTRVLEEKTLTAGAVSFTAASGTLDIEDGAVIRDTAGNDSPCSIITQDEYNAISDKDISGKPTRYFPKENDDDTFTVYFDRVPDSTVTTFIYPRVRKVRDLETGNLHLDCPTKWIHAMKLMLAWMFAKHYRRPIEQVMDAKEDWESAKARILRDEAPRGPVRFTVEPIWGSW